MSWLTSDRAQKCYHGRFGANTVQMRAGLLRYILKGIDASAFRYTGLAGETESIAEALGIQFSGNQGLINIKRSGTSQNIGLKARRDADWVEVRDLPALRRILVPEEHLQSAVVLELNRLWRRIPRQFQQMPRPETPLHPANLGRVKNITALLKNPGYIAARKFHLFWRVHRPESLPWEPPSGRRRE
jgi:hypothetical protein